MSESKSFQLASPAHRVASQLVDAGLCIVTFGIGWLIWNLITWGQGQTPAKNLLKLRVIDETKNRPAKWGQMCIRQSLIPLTMSLVFFIPYLAVFATGFTFGVNAFIAFSFLACLGMGLAIYILDIVWLFGPKRKRLVDYWAKTIVVNEANNISKNEINSQEL